MNGVNNRPLPTGAERKRGRPRGHNRTSLTEEERRTRNTNYERERRIEQAEATAALTQAMGCGGKIKFAELLALTIMRLKPSEPSIQEMKEENEAMEAEIAQLETILASESEDSGVATSTDQEQSLPPRSSHSLQRIDEEASNGYQAYPVDWQSDASSEVYTDDGHSDAARCRPHVAVKKTLLSYSENNTDARISKRHHGEEAFINCHSAKRLKLGSDDESSTSSVLFGGFFNTFKFLTTRPQEAAVTEPEIETSPEHEVVTSPVCESNVETQESFSTASATEIEEEADLLLCPEDLKTLESLLAEDGFTDGIPLWSSPEDIDFEVFPPTT